MPTSVPPTDWRLEKLSAEGGAPASPEDAQRLAELRRSNDEILAALPPARVGAEVQRRLRASRRNWTLWLSVPILAAAALLLVPRLHNDEPQERIKGMEPHLVVYRQTGDGPIQLGAEPAAKAGEVIQLRAVPSGQAYGVVLSVDGRGAVTLHYPEESEGPDGAAHS